MEKKMKNKYKLIIICAVFTVIISSSLSNYNSFAELNDACVDQSNGNIAISYYDSTRSCTKLCVYDLNGNRLFGISFDGGPHVYMQYEESVLWLYISRTNNLYSLDMSGNILLEEKNPDLNSEHMKKLREENWRGWTVNGLTKQTSYEEINYIYEVSPFFERIIGKGSCELYILSPSGTETMIYQGE